MYHIFICDDEKRELGILREKLEICLQKQKKEYEIQWNFQMEIDCLRN